MLVSLRILRGLRPNGLGLLFRFSALESPALGYLLWGRYFGPNFPRFSGKKKARLKNG